MVIRAGVIGHPIAHSLSPRIHNTWFADHGLAGEYNAVDVHPDDLADAIRRLMESGWAGVNVTLPHKQAAYELADIANPVAEAQGAANLLIFSDGKVIANNTDVAGFRRCMGSSVGEGSHHRAVVLGAGGAAGPIIQNVLFCDEIVVINRTSSKAEELARRFGPRVRAGGWEELADLLPDTDYLINATSLGMRGQPALDVDASLLPSHAEVFDIVYAPLETSLLTAARARGLKAVGGLPMLVYQAAPSFKAFTGVEVRNPEAVLKSLEADLS